MFAPIEEMPTGIIGFEARGRITGKDRQQVLEPRIVSALADGGRVKLLYLAGMDFAGYDEGGVFDDAVFGTRHFTSFERIAFVGFDGPHAHAVEALAGLMPAALRRFARGDLEAAKAWLAE